MNTIRCWFQQPDEQRRNQLQRLAAAVMMVALLGFAWQTRNRLIHAALPYCRATDEAHWTRSALKIVRTGDWNPHRFTKPSVQVYLTTAGFSLGLLRTPPGGKKGYLPESVGKRAYPYYTATLPVLTARQLFAGLSVAALGLGALIMRRLTGSTACMVLGLAFALLSPRYLWLSWSYINVDILGVFFAVATTLYLLHQREQAPPNSYARLAGILCGLTIGCKYNLFPILLPAFLAIGLYHRKRWFSLSLITLVSAGLTFVATTPYIIFDFSSFLTALAKEAHHYATGHPHRTVEAGFPMFWAYCRDVAGALGIPALGLAFAGMAGIARRDPKGVLIALAYPVALLIYMAQQRVFFQRNLLILHLVLPLFAGPGLVFVWGWLVTIAERHLRWLRTGVQRQVLVGATLAVLVGIGTPWARVAKAHDTEIESRNEVIPWLTRQFPKKTRIVVPKQLAFDTRRLRPRFEVKRFDAETTSLRDLARKYPGAVALIPAFVKSVRGKTLDLTDLRGTSFPSLGEFGTRELELRYNKAHGKVINVPSGDPRFNVIQL